MSNSWAATVARSMLVLIDSEGDKVRVDGNENEFLVLMKLLAEGIGAMRLTLEVKPGGDETLCDGYLLREEEKGRYPSEFSYRVAFRVGRKGLIAEARDRWGETTMPAEQAHVVMSHVQVLPSEGWSPMKPGKCNLPELSEKGFDWPTMRWRSRL